MLEDLGNEELGRVKEHEEQLQGLQLRPDMLKKKRPAILHLEDSEWDKRCDLIKFLFPDCELPDASAGITAAEQFFCYCSLRGKDGSVVKEGITKLAGKLDDTICNIATLCSSNGSAVKRLVEKPDLLLSSLKTVSGRLGFTISKLFSTVCSAGNCAVIRLVEKPDLLLSSLETVSGRLGESSSSSKLFSTVCSLGGSVVIRLVEKPDLLLSSLETVSERLGFTISQLWRTVCCAGDSAVIRLVEKPDLLLSSLETVSGRLGEPSSTVFSIVCFAPRGTVIRLIEKPETFPSFVSLYGS
jgi:hypothetical protein